MCKIPFSLGIYGVGKAAQHPPALAVLSHTPSGATQTIAWVGKGIVYDTGGLSIKGKVNTTPHHQPSALKDGQNAKYVVFFLKGDIVCHFFGGRYSY